jgi:hypothetical protein
MDINTADTMKAPRNHACHIPHENAPMTAAVVIAAAA